LVGQQGGEAVRPGGARATARAAARAATAAAAGREETALHGRSDAPQVGVVELQRAVGLGDPDAPGGQREGVTAACTAHVTSTVGNWTVAPPTALTVPEVMTRGVFSGSSSPLCRVVWAPSVMVCDTTSGGR